MRHLRQGLLALGIALFAAAATSVPPGGHLTNGLGEEATFDAWLDNDGRLRIADLPLGSVDGCGICDYCEILATGEMGHVAIDTKSGLATRGDGWHIREDCLPGYCFDEHPVSRSCLSGPRRLDDVLTTDELAALWPEIRAGTVAGPDLAAQYSTNVEWNAERNALQVFDCAGTMVAHVSVTDGGAVGS